MTKRLAAFATAITLLPGIASAHHFMGGGTARTWVEGLLSGLGHPVIGVDHAAFIVAAGFLLGPLPHGPRALFALLAGALAGAALHLAGTGLPFGEAAVALSVLVAGAVLASGRRVPLAWMAGALAAAGVLHGHAYAESIFGAEPAPLAAYLAGFTLVQLGIATGALLAQRRLAAGAGGKRLPAALGAAVGAIGALFFAGALVA